MGQVLLLAADAATAALAASGAAVAAAVSGLPVDISKLAAAAAAGTAKRLTEEQFELYLQVGAVGGCV